MKGKVCFGIELGWLQTGYANLKELAIAVKKIDSSKYLWLFDINDREKVTAILGKPIELGDLVTEVVDDKSRKKGEGFFKLTAVTPKAFVCETIINEKKVKKFVPKVNVETAWEVVKSYPLRKPIHSSTVAKRIIRSLSITRFDRPSGSFDWAKFFGNRKDYYDYFYSPMKILESECVIIHHKAGKIERIADKWDIQKVFVPQIVRYEL